MTEPIDPRRITVYEAHALAERGEALLVDSRDPHLFENAHIKGARSLPPALLKATNGGIPPGLLPEHPRQLLFYCA